MKSVHLIDFQKVFFVENLSRAVSSTAFVCCQEKKVG